MEREKLQQLKIFQGVRESAVDAVLESAKKDFFPNERLIIYEWERIDNKWYIILAGEVSICIKKIEIAKLWVWEIFWEMWLIIWEKRKATVRACQDTEVLEIDFDKLMMLIDNDENKINKEVIRRMESNLLVENPGS